MATSVNSPPTGLLPMELPLTRYAEGSRARTSQTLASRLALRVSEAVSGLNTPVSLANYDPASSSWKTSQRCLIEGWTVFSETWPRSGMMRSGIAYQLAPLAPLTSGTGFGSWPTPNAAPLTNSTSLRCSGDGRTKPNKLGWAVAMWPTPTTFYTRENWSIEKVRAKQAEVKAATLAKGKHQTGNGFGLHLAHAVKMWPTPSARDWKDNPGAWMWNATNPDGTHRNRTDQLPRKVYAVEGTAQNGGQLNPTWVEWLMGFPLGHTDLEPSETP